METLAHLNEEQLAPVLDTEGAVLVLAGAGSGKTRVLTSRIEYLITEKNVPAETVLAITFTNKAAAEMKSRLEYACDTSRMWVCTIHSMCVKILRLYAEQRGLKANFSIYSEQERAAVIKQTFRECGYDDESLLKSVKFHIGNAKMLGLSPAEYGKRNRYERGIADAMKIFKKYDAHLKANNALDFDDLLIEALALLRENAEARDYLAGRFRYIHVDEFQDTNEVQFEIIKILASGHGNLFAVGDDDQSIYGWRGARLENILNFEQSFPNAKIYKLQRNYRSTASILRLANIAIANNRIRKGKKELWTEEGEGEKPVYFEAEEELGEALYVAQTIGRLVREGYKLSDFAVLMRINALTRAFEQEFTKYNLNYKVFGGFKFFERKEIKDALAYLRLISNPYDDEACMRIINVPKRGIGDKTIDILREYAAREELSLYDAVMDCDFLALPAGTKERVRGFGDYVKSLVVRSQTDSVDELVDYLLETSGMREQYADSSDDSVTKRANLDEFKSSVDEYVKMNGQSSLSEYLQQISLYSDTDEMEEGDYVTIATIHAVKGLEFKCVFIVGLEENIIPSPRAIEEQRGVEEERRLLYVAITRAKERLFLTRSKSRYLYGRREQTVRSPFVDELKGELALPERTYRPSYDTSRRYGSTGYGFGAPVRVSSYRETQKEEGYTTFGGGSRRPASFNAATMSASKPSQTERKDTSGYKVGARVRHTRFGEGTVIAMRGSGSNLIITVHFPMAGNKDLAAALAPLEILP